MLKILGIGFALIIALLLLWHLFFPILGGAIVISSMVWILIIAAIVGFCMLIPLLFVLTGIGIILLPIFAAVGVILLIIAFPVLFPLLIPLLIIVWIIAIMRKRRMIKKDDEINGRN